MTDLEKMSTRGTALDDTIFTRGTVLATTYDGMHDNIKKFKITIFYVRIYGSKERCL
jgi:hypothetical protein